MERNYLVKVLGLLVAVLFFILAVLSWTGTFHSTLIFGHSTMHNYKHTILYAVLGVLALLWVRFQGSDATSSR